MFFLELVLIGTTLLCRGLGLLGLTFFTAWQNCTSVALALMLVMTATTHFTATRYELTRMVPSFLPFPQALVTLTGIFEFLGAFGLLFPLTRNITGWCLILLLLVMFPANVKAAREQLPLRGKTATPLWLRIPMQLLFIGYALIAALPAFNP